ncbi:MAG: hypothetical protein RBR59_02300 [Sulfurimonadaceae bacterium]|jgi:hypothetical protein|nr:hypothetical protein [Sulfurimonadaceae bacterium]
MKLWLVATGLASVLVFTGCSSTSAEDVAYSMCELAKKGDVKGMKQYAEPEFAEALDALDQMFQNVLKNEAAKKEFEKNMALLKDVNCKETTVITDISDTKKQVANVKTSQVFFLLLIDGAWKVVGQ